MQNLETVVASAEAIIKAVALYKEKPTKAESKRIRAYINDIKRVGTAAKQELLDADKA